MFLTFHARNRTEKAIFLNSHEAAVIYANSRYNIYAIKGELEVSEVCFPVKYAYFGLF